MTVGFESKKVTRTSFGIKELKLRAESLAKLEDVIEATLAVLGTLQWKAESAF